MTSAREQFAQDLLDQFLRDQGGGNALRVYREGVNSRRYGNSQLVANWVSYDLVS